MALRKTLVASAAAVALVAAPAIAVAPAAQAKEVAASGTTLVSFKKEYAGIFKMIKPVKPAKFIDSRLTFPVTGIDTGVIMHKGGIKLGALKAMRPNVVINEEKKRARVFFDIGGKETQVFWAKHFKVKADGPKGEVWQGNLHVTKNKAVVKVLNDSLGVNSITPGLGVGQIRVTVKTG